MRMRAALVGLLGLGIVGACSGEDAVVGPPDVQDGGTDDRVSHDAPDTDSALEDALTDALDSGANPLDVTCDPAGANTCPPAEGENGDNAGTFCMNVHTPSSPYDVYGHCTFICEHTDTLYDAMLKRVCTHLGGRCIKPLEYKSVCIEADQ